MDSRLNADAEKLRRLEAPYLRARDFLASTGRSDANIAALKRIGEIVTVGIAAKSDASMVVGRIAELLHSLDESQRVVDQYEALKRSLDARVASSRAVDSAPRHSPDA